MVNYIISNNAGILVLMMDHLSSIVPAGLTLVEENDGGLFNTPTRGASKILFLETYDNKSNGVLLTATYEVASDVSNGYFFTFNVPTVVAANASEQAVSINCVSATVTVDKKSYLDLKYVLSAADFAAMEPDGTYYLDADIVLSSSYTKLFTGCFYGNGHTVTVSCPMFQLFDGKIKDLTVNGVIRSNDGMPTAAIAVRSVNGMYAENVTTNVDITLSGQKRGMYAAGFLASDYIVAADNIEYYGGNQPENNKNACSTFINCRNTGNITINATVQNYDNSTTASNMKPRAGGLAAMIQGVYCINCENSGNISIPLSNLIIESEHYIINDNCTSAIAGGLIARAGTNSAIVPATFLSCKNSGNITAYGNAAGIAAYLGINGNINVFRFYACVNSGTIKAPNQAGGICAYVYGNANEYADIEFCLNTGDIYYGDTDGTNFGAPFVSYSNSVATTILGNISTGMVMEIGDGYSSFAHAIIGCSSADPLSYNFFYNAVFDPFNHFTMFSMCLDNDEERNYENRHTIQEAIETEHVFVLNNLDSIISGEMASTLNSKFKANGSQSLEGDCEWKAITQSDGTGKISGKFLFDYKWHQSDSDVLPSAYNSYDTSCVTIDLYSNALLGDANNDGLINLKDLVLLSQYLVNYNVATKESTVVISSAADTNSDDEINITDIIRLRKYIANIDPNTSESLYPLAHIHSFEPDWRNTSTKHWKECSCGMKMNLDEHTFGDWTVSQAATAHSSGFLGRSCSLCGYKESMTYSLGN